MLRAVTTGPQPEPGSDAWLQQLNSLPRSTPVPGSPEWWYPLTGMIQVDIDTAGNPVLTKPADIWKTIQGPGSSGILAWLQQNQNVVLIGGAALFAIALLGGRR